MASKLDAAHKARHFGATVVISSALEDDCLLRIFRGDDVGTVLPRVGSVLRARKHWIAYTLRPRGAVLVDAGAARALSNGNSSLLPVGVVGLRGEFRRGDSVQVLSLDGREVARGLTRMSALEVARSAGKRGPELAAALGGDADAVVVHRDDLVPTS
jgi:glutamate 5-kinase